MPSPGLAVRLLGPSALAVVALAANGAAAQELQLWSHWADHETKVAFVEEAVRRFEEQHPGATVKISWYQKPPLQAALAASLQAGQGPDIFYCETGWSEYVDNGLLAPLDDLVDWSNVEDWARKSWTFDGKTYGFPLEVSTVEMYYNTDELAKLGVELPAEQAARPGGVRGARQDGGRRRHHADRPGHRRPALSRRLSDQRDAAQEARQGGLRQAPARRAVVQGPARRSRSFQFVEDLVEGGRLSEELLDPQARRVALLFPHQPGRPHVPDGQLVHQPRLQPASTRAASPRTSRSASCASRRPTMRPAPSARR